MAAGKGLKKDALSFVSNVTIGVSSTSPAYSIAATLGPIVGAVAFGSPAVMLVAFIPMLCIAVSFYHLNRAVPDCGTTFAWATRAIGPRTGWIGGWSVIITNILVMPSLADIAGRYTFQLIGVADPSAAAVIAVGVAWIAVITAICYLGIALSARTQHLLLGAEVVILVVFSVVALFQVYSTAPPADSHPVMLAWFNPFAIGDANTFTQAMVLAVFLYWGWDSCLAVNEETKDPHTAPGYAGLVSTVILVGLYVLVVAAAVAVAGHGVFAAHNDDVLAPIGNAVLGPTLGRFLVFAVLTSSLASTQTSILPAARMALSMAHAGAVPDHFGRVHPHYLSPGFATLAMGIISIVWYVGLTLLSTDVLTDSIAALGLVVAFYYGLTGFSCVVFYRNEILRGPVAFISKGVIPGAGGLMMLALFIKACFVPDDSSISVFGVAGPVAIGLGMLVAGGVLMLIAQRYLPAFFRTRPVTAPQTSGGSP